MILITGTKGYIGSRMYNYFLKRGYEVKGLDCGYFKNCDIKKLNSNSKTKLKDIRLLSIKDFKNIDTVIHLAALSNDPIGNFNNRWTRDINHKASIEIAKLARKAGVKKFLFSSSCIMYGVSNNLKAKTENDETNPQTMYAKSKVSAEKQISKLADNNFAPVFIRNGTIYGISKHMRLDTVLNNFIANAIFQKKIIINSSGKQWRPVTYLDDVCRYFETIMLKDQKLINNQIFNVGNNNTKIIELAQLVKKNMPDIDIDVKNSKDADNRTYKVSFRKFNSYFPEFKFTPLERGIKMTVNSIRKNLSKAEYKNEKFIRLSWLTKMINSRKIDKDLFL